LIIAQKADIDALLKVYPSRVIKFGDLHNHTDSGPTADGRMSLTQWKAEMKRLGMSFAAIVDHKQVAHMYHKDWQTQSTEESDIVFIGGSEPGSAILDSKAEQSVFHYNMLLNDPEKLLDIVRNNGKFCIKSSRYEDFNWSKAFGCTNKVGTYDPADYAADPTGILETWTYPKFTTAEFGALADTIYEAGGLLVHVHPKYSSYLISDDPLDYFFGNVMGIEIFTSGNTAYSPGFCKNDDAYQMWVGLLAAGKRAYATSGCDNHRLPNISCFSNMYASEHPSADEYMGYIHNGNMTPGWVGIRMCVGDTAMGGKTNFAGKRLVFSVGDMYSHPETKTNELYAEFDPSYDPDREYVLQLYDEKELLLEQPVDPGKMNYFALDADPDVKLYRVVV
jgi:hypothetical protein